MPSFAEEESVFESIVPQRKISTSKSNSGFKMIAAVSLISGGLANSQVYWSEGMTINLKYQND